MRVSGIGRMPKIAAQAAAQGPSLDAARTRTGQCVFRAGGRLQAFDTAFYRRERLPLDTALPGPAVVLQKDSTTVVPPGWRAIADREGNLILSGGTR